MKKTVLPHHNWNIGGIILIFLGLYLLLERYIPFLNIHIGALLLIALGLLIVLKKHDK